MSVTFVNQGTNVRQLAYDAARHVLIAELQDDEWAGTALYKNDDLLFTEIDDIALSAWRANWEPHGNRIYDWEWPEWLRKARYSPSRFEAALWSAGQLCGLALGKLSKGREVLSVQLIEGSPDRTHPLKGIVGYGMVQLAELYATAWGCKKVKLLEPTERAAEIYEQMGYCLASEKGILISCDKELVL